MGESCCCGPTKPKDRIESPTPRSVPGDEHVNPCLKIVPCQVPGLPATSSVVPIDKVITLVAVERVMPALSQGLFHLPFSCVLPDRRAARIDDPPELPSLG